MSAATYQPILGLQDLESGLKRLCRSQLMRIPEFKKMYGAVERHHRDVKLAHLTGKAKDQQNKAERDTKFYNILVRMLCEIEERRTGGQRDGLRQVHTWYMTNRHVLHSGPYFGKEYLKEEAKEILRKATASKHLVHTKLPNRQLVIHNVTLTQTGRISSGNSQEAISPAEDLASPTSHPKEMDSEQQPASILSDYADSEPVSRAATNSPELGDLNFDIQFDPCKKSIMLDQDFNHNSHAVPSHSPSRAIMRPKTASTVTFSPLTEKSGNLPTSVTTIRGMVHPISSLVNPHTALATMLSHTTAGQLDGKSCHPERALSARFSRSESLQAWQTFNKKRSYGQDVISKLNFVGRSGTAADIRYSAHGHGHNPEAYTEDFVKHYTRHANSVTKDPVDEDDVFFHQTLEEFYQTAENIRPMTSSASRMSSFARVNSASSVVQSGNRTASQISSRGKTTKHKSNMSQPFQQQDDWFGQEEEIAPENDTGINLDTVVNAIDSVTGNMAHYREKLVPEPQHGFRQPSTTGLPNPRDGSSSFNYNASTDCVCSTSAGIHQRTFSEIEASRPFSSPLASNIVRSDMSHGLKKAKIRCISAGVVDWRGRIQPETIRYKWSKTNFGGHTYLKKWYRPNHRSAGSTSGGSRPKTAPITTKEKWKTQQQPSDKNTRVIQAASHNTTLVDQNDVESLMQVQHLFSGDEKIPSVDSLNNEDATRKKFKRNTKEIPVMEYLSFVVPSATAPVEHKTQKSTENSGKVEDKDKISPSITGSSSENIDQLQPLVTSDKILHALYDEDALNAAVREGLDNLTSDYSMPSPASEMNSLKPKTRKVQEDSHVKKANNPVMFMNKVDRSRSIESPCYSLPHMYTTGDSLIGTSLQVYKLSVPTRGHSLQVLTEDHHPSSKPRTAPSIGNRTGFVQSEDLVLHKNTAFRSASSKQIDGQGSTDAQHALSVRSFSKIGRPIAQVSQIPDPDELLQAVQLKKEAAAAVDIQRIFRGYVARNVYKSLLSEERLKREEARKAAERIQRMYRGHLARKHAIYNRPNLDPEIVQWSDDVKELQSENSAKRQSKVAKWTDEMSANHRTSKNKLAVIGPHVEIYGAYHPKKTGPSKQELNMAAVKIQKVVRGWILRRKMKKLSVKAKWYGSNFYKLAKEYKAMLKRVQQQHGMDKPKAPFSLKDFNQYMDLRRRYESIFEKKSFGGELEQGALEAFFKGCDLYPSQTEIEEAMDVTMHGLANKRGNRGLTKKELMDMIFYIYVPPAAGLEGTRRSTWMNPIIDGQEARQLLGSEFVEPTPLAPCLKLVIESKLQQRQRENAQKSAEERRRIEDAEKRILEDKQAARKTKKKVTLQTPENQSS